MLIPTYYLLSKIWDIFATRRRILLEINKNYFRGGEVKTKTLEPITKARVDLVFMRAFSFAEFPRINKRYERKFGYLNYFTYLCAAFLEKPRSLLC